MPTIRDYDITYTPGNTYATVNVSSAKKSNTYLAAVPTEEEVNELLETQDVVMSFPFLFSVCPNLKASPRLPEKGRLQGNSSTDGLFNDCTSLVIAPKLPTEYVGTIKSVTASFRGCTSLKQAPVIPREVERVSNMFRGTSVLSAPVSLPSNVKQMSYMYYGAALVQGEIVVRATPTSYTDAFYNTTKPITLYGDQAICETLAATANNGNVTWSPWYDPVPAVTNRGQGSYTTAADMTRMVRNGVLAVNTYAPGRMSYQQGDIVREDEWISLVEAAQTIDPAVTLSTHYTNLNRIEAAFDSAL